MSWIVGNGVVDLFEGEGLKTIGMLSGDRPSKKAYTMESKETRVPVIQYPSSCRSTYCVSIV